MKLNFKSVFISDVITVMGETISYIIIVIIIVK